MADDGGHMKIFFKVAATGAVALASLSACGASPRNETEYLRIEFAPVCKDGEIWLRGTLRNESAATVRIENGVLPWEYDPVGTSFNANSETKQLTRNPAVPLIGRTGPIDLQPRETRSGDVPIAFMFPEITALAGKQRVVIDWVYWTKPKPNESERLKGTTVLSEDPCSH
jgi:hypothetical protein